MQNRNRLAQVCAAALLGLSVVAAAQDSTDTQAAAPLAPQVTDATREPSPGTEADQVAAASAPSTDGTSLQDLKVYPSF